MDRRRKYEIQALRQGELARRRSLKLPEEERMLIEEMRREKKLGVSWTCPGCYTEYRVKTPFRELYCFGCLEKLIRCPSVLPPSPAKKGYWVLEE